MKIVCVNIDTISDTNKFRDALLIKKADLTIGKSYEIIKKTDIYCRIIDDIGEITIYDNRRFISVEEHRNNKLNQLGI